MATIARPCPSSEAPSFESSSTAVACVENHVLIGPCVNLATASFVKGGLMRGIAGTALGLFGNAELDGFAALCAYVDGVDGVDADAVAFAAVADSVDGALALPRARALNRVGCAYALLARLQQRTPVVLSAWALLARLPVVFGEARHVAPGSVTTYATRTPDYRYVEERR